MIAVLYGRSASPFVDSVIADLQAAAAARGADIVPVAIESALGASRSWESVERLYVLPFDIPAHLPESLPTSAAPLIKALFPRAEVFNPAPVHELAWDKLAMAHRLLERGVPMPDTLITSDPEEAADFVRQHGQAILKETRSCGGHGHVVLFAADAGAIGGEVPGRRYAIELTASGVGRKLEHGVLTCPPPFYLQRLVTDISRTGVLKPAQVLRAYIVDSQTVFWTERYRPRFRRPADFLINVTFGARYRFLPEVSDAVQTTARRAAEALGVRIGAVDLIRSGGAGPYVLEVDTDGHHMMIDRSFKQLPEFRDPYDYDRYIAELLLAPARPVQTAPPRRPPARARKDPPAEIRRARPGTRRAPAPRSRRSR